MVGLLILALVVASVIVIPLLLLGLVVRLAIGLVLLPLRIAGLAIRLTLGLVGLALAGVLLLLIPLLPVILLVGGIWMLFRLARSRPAARLAID